MSKTPLSNKLRILPGSRVLIFHAADDYQELEDAPEGVNISTTVRGEFDIVLPIFTQKADLDAQIELLKSAMGDKGILWISYPKASSRKVTDLNRDILRTHLAHRGLQGISLIAFDEIRSAMRFKKQN